MKIAMITETSATGVGRNVTDLGRGLSEAGHEVHVIYSTRRIDDRFEKWASSGAHIRFCRVDMVRSIAPADIVSLAHIVFYLRRHGPFDIVHGHSSKGGAMARLSALFVGTAIIYTPHAISTLDESRGVLARRILARIELLLSKVTTRIIAVSKGEQKHLISLGIRPGIVCHIPNAVDPIATDDRERSRAAFGIGPHCICFGFVGRLSAQKAPLRLVEVAEEFARRTSREFIFIIVGTGELESELRARIAASGLEQRIILAGDREGRQVIGAFDVAVLTSRYEAGPIFPMEAVAAGIPVVAMDVAGLEDVVQDGVNGYITRNGDIGEFASRLVALLNPDHLAAMKGHSKALRGRYRVIDMIRKTEALYASCAPAVELRLYPTQ
jgi:glycosyltransferase involved in cell wall biosynthesis